MQSGNQNEINPQDEQGQGQEPQGIQDPFANMFKGEELFGVREEEPNPQ